MSTSKRYVPVSALPAGFTGRQFLEHARAHGKTRDAFEARMRGFMTDNAHHAAWLATLDAEEHLELARKSIEPRARASHVAAGIRSLERVPGYLADSRVPDVYDGPSPCDPVNLLGRCNAVGRAFRDLFPATIAALPPLPYFVLLVEVSA